MRLDDIRDYKLNIEADRDHENTAFLKEDTDLTVTHQMLLHAVISCGIPDERFLPDYPGKRRAELLRRFSLMEYSLEARGEYLQKSDRVLELDESERSLVSYYLGMMITRLVSRSVYGVDFLVPLKNLCIEQGQESYIFRGRRRTDLIGARREGEDFLFSIWEAKGRSNNSIQALDEGCREASEILAVNGAAPERTASCMTYYGSRCLAARLKKGAGQSAENFSVNVPEEIYFRAYYDVVFGLIRECYETESVHNRIRLGREEIQAVLLVSDGRKLTVGLPRALFFALYEGDREALLVAVKELEPGSDGIFVSLNP